LVKKKRAPAAHETWAECIGIEKFLAMNNFTAVLKKKGEGKGV